MERLRALGEFTPPTLSQLEEALDGCAQISSAAVTADTWDTEKLARCEACRPARTERLRRINVSGRAEPRIACDVCGGR
jgi:archaeosine synthase beta-subunit